MTARASSRTSKGAAPPSTAMNIVAAQRPSIDELPTTPGTRSRLPKCCQRHVLLRDGDIPFHRRLDRSRPTALARRVTTGPAGRHPLREGRGLSGVSVTGRIEVLPLATTPFVKRERPQPMRNRPHAVTGDPTQTPFSGGVRCAMRGGDVATSIETIPIQANSLALGR